VSPALDLASERRNLRTVHVCVSRSISPWWIHLWENVACRLIGAAIAGFAVWAFDRFW
jgi:hypothetical protein